MCVYKNWIKSSMVVVYLVHEEICIEFVLIDACCLGLVPAHFTCHLSLSQLRTLSCHLP